MSDKQIKYIGRDFPELKQELLNFIQQYYPDYFNSVTDYTVEMMMVELMSAIGDMNNFYIDDRFRESFIQYAEEPASVFRNAKEMGYKPKTVSVAFGNVTFSQLVPWDGDEAVLTKCVTIYPGSTFTDASTSITYTSTEIVRIGDDPIIDEKNVITIDNEEYVTVSKRIPVRSGTTKVKNISFDSTPIPYNSVLLDTNVAFVQSVTDSEKNPWYEVEFLAQDTVFVDVYDPNEKLYNLHSKVVPNRFITDHTSTGECHMKFGSGIGASNSSEYINLADEVLKSSTEAFLLENSLRTDSYGNIPYATTLTVTYVTSNGETENIKANNVKVLSRVDYGTTTDGLNTAILQSFKVNNDEPITGAGYLNDIERIRREASINFMSQNRCVTTRDYKIRAMTLPQKYGSIFKSFVEQDLSGNVVINVLSKSSDKHLINCNDTTKQNLLTYIREYKMVNDDVKIQDANIINFGIDYKFVVKNGYDKPTVQLNISKKMEEYFNIDKWELNQPIVIQNVISEMMTAEGVMTVWDLTFKNLVNTIEGRLYSSKIFDMKVENGIIFPPSLVGMFELKYPMYDIKGTM